MPPRRSRQRLYPDAKRRRGPLLVKLREYLLATVYVTLVFLIRVTILVLSVPLFVMVAAIGIVDGFGSARFAPLRRGV